MPGLKITCLGGSRTCGTGTSFSWDISVAVVGCSFDAELFDRVYELLFYQLPKFTVRNLA